MPTNCFCARLPMITETTPASGTIASVSQASSGLTVNIMMVTPISVSTEFSSCPNVCCSVCETLSMSLVIRLSNSPRGWASK